jgi:hypothetical protein
MLLRPSLRLVSATKVTFPTLSSGHGATPLQVRSSRRNDLRSPSTRPRCDFTSGSLQPPKRPSLSLRLATVRLHFGFAPAAETTFALPPLGHGATSLRVRSSRRNDLRCPSVPSRCGFASGLLQSPKRPSTRPFRLATVRLHFGFAPVAETTFALPPLGHGVQLR